MAFRPCFSAKRCNSFDVECAIVRDGRLPNVPAVRARGVLDRLSRCPVVPLKRGIVETSNRNKLISSVTIQPHPLLVFSFMSWPQSQAVNTCDTAVPVG